MQWPKLWIQIVLKSNLTADYKLIKLLINIDLIDPSPMRISIFLNCMTNKTSLIWYHVSTYLLHYSSQ